MIVRYRDPTFEDNIPQTRRYDERAVSPHDTVAGTVLLRVLAI